MVGFQAQNRNHCNVKGPGVLAVFNTKSETDFGYYVWELGFLLDLIWAYQKYRGIANFGSVVSPYVSQWQEYLHLLIYYMLHKQYPVGDPTVSEHLMTHFCFIADQYIFA